MTNTAVPLRDGRTVHVYDLGDPAGRPALFFHGGGLGATGAFALPWDEAARRLQVRLVAPDRPGLGGSSPRPGRTLADWPNDVAEVADALGIGRFVAIAHSGGAGYALACAARMPERVAALSVVSPVTSRTFAAAHREIPTKTWREMWLFDVMPRWLVGLVLGRVVAGMQRDPARSYASFLGRLPACERALLATGEHRDRLGACAAAAFSQGPAAVVADLRLIFADWGFSLDRVRAPATIWSGDADATSPPQMAQALAAALPHARLEPTPDAGHVTTWMLRRDDILGRIGLCADASGRTHEACV